MDITYICAYACLMNEQVERVHTFDGQSRSVYDYGNHYVLPKGLRQYAEEEDTHHFIEEGHTISELFV